MFSRYYFWSHTDSHTNYYFQHSTKWNKLFKKQWGAACLMANITNPGYHFKLTEGLNINIMFNI